MTTTLFDGGTVIDPTRATAHDWALVDDERIVATGSRSDVPDAHRRIDLRGATLAPAFCDAHVHLPATGLYEAGLDLRSEKSARRVLAALGERAKGSDALLFGGNFEDPLEEPLDAAALDSAVGDRPALLARADMHSCVVSSALLDSLDIDDLEGVDRDEEGRPTGYLREAAAGRAWSWFERSLSARQQREALRRAARRAYSKGVASVHEMYVVEWRGWGSLDVVSTEATNMALNVTLYVGTTDVERVQALGLSRIGGDLFLDGSFGSHTAWLMRPYRSPPPAGIPPTGLSYRDDEEVASFFAHAQQVGMQVGVHAIGDAAIEQAIGAWEQVASVVGVEPVRSLGHRIEHFECASDEHITRALRLGLRASVQPAFDLFWGGSEGLYADRLGPGRALQMNRFASMHRAGLILGAGSDSTVTPLDPILGMDALRRHHVAQESVDARDALCIHTLGGHILAGQEAERGTFDAGRAADLVALDRNPLTAPAEEAAGTEVVGTWIGGRRVWPEADMEAA